MPRMLLNLIGKKFGLLTAHHPEKRNGRIMWLCHCECGNEVWVARENLQGGRVRSCGCMQYGWRKTPEGRERVAAIGRYVAKCRVPDSVNKDETRNATSLSGYRGVVYNKATNKWRVRVVVSGKRHEIGSFDNLDDAVNARIVAEDKYLQPLHRAFLGRRDEIMKQAKKQLNKELAEIEKKYKKDGDGNEPV